MRALLVILIVGGLLWFLIQGFGPSLAKDPEPEHSGGTMLAEEPSNASSEPAPEAAPEETPAAATPASTEPVQVRPEPAPAPKPAVATADKPATPAAPSAVAEVELAARLVHQTPSFAEWIATADTGLRPGRRDLARALALQLEGRTEEAAALVRQLGSADDLGADERKLLEFWPQGPAFAMPAATSGGSLLLRAAGMASAERVGREALAASRWQEAVQAYSMLLQEELRSPWDAEPQCMTQWAEALNKAQRGYRWNRKATWPALELKVAPGDSLISVRKRALQEQPGLVTCTGLIARANQLQGETIHPGQSLRIPTGKPHVLVDLSARWLLFLLDDEVVGAWPVGVGKPGNETPPGSYVVGEKSTDPTWFRAGEAPVPAGDPRNPLGTRWIAWIDASGEKTHLGFHGTHDPESIGQDESEGCVRMLNRHVEELYEILPRSSEVLVQP